MTQRKPWIRFATFTTAALIGAAAVSTQASSQTTGPSSSQSPYILPVAPGVKVTSILTTGDSVNSKPNSTTPYRLAGIPDGLGAFNNEDGTFTLLVNHELGGSVGTTRAHGAIGAFVSKWIINRSDLKVVSGGDLIQNVQTWNKLTSTYNAPAKGVVFSRFCSADLPLQFAFYDPLRKVGMKSARFFMNGEETGPEGRAFAHGLDGLSTELPRLGKMSFENVLVHPYTGLKTTAIMLDDATPGQVYVYIGTKSNTGSVLERAGLTNGQLYGIKVNGYPLEIGATGIPNGTRFSLEPLGNVSNMTGAQIETVSTNSGVTRFLRPEDGAWNVNNLYEFFFNTTNAFNAPSRLWRLSFADIFNPERGGRIDMFLNGSEGQQMLDNIGIDLNNRALLQEDPGNQAYIAKLRLFNLQNGKYDVVAQHDPARFTPGAAGFITQDEESSGIIDARDILGNGWFLMADQIHKASSDAELVEGGQLQAMFVPIPKGQVRNPFPRYFGSNPKMK